MMKGQNNMPGLQIKNPIPVGRKGEEGAASWLIASRDDIDAGNLNGPAQKYDELSGEFTDARPLQVWFKFGVWPGVDHDTPLPMDVGGSAAGDDMVRAMTGGESDG